MTLDAFPQISQAQNEIRVILASNGRVCLQTKPTKDFSTVKSLSFYLQTITNINIHQQILLNDKGEKLPDNDYLNAHIGSLYLFNRSHFSSQNTEVDDQSIYEEEDALLKEFEVDFKEDEIRFPPHLERSNTPFIEFQRQFYADNEHITSIVKRSEKQHNLVLQKYQEIKFQNEAIKSALENLYGHSKKISRIANKFHEEFEITGKRFKDHADNFESNLDKLGKINLHPELVTETQKTLRDFVKEPQLRLWLQKCAREHQAFSEHVDKGKTRFSKVQSDVEKVQKSEFDVNFNDLRNFTDISEKKLQKNIELKNRLHEDYESFLDTVRSASNEVELVESEELEKKLKSTALGRKNTLEIAKENLKEIKEILSTLIERKKESVRRFFTCLNTIAAIQYSFRKLTKEYSSTFIFILQDLKRKFAQIEIVQYFPGAYQLSCLEISRRREFLRTYENEIAKSKQNIRQIREKELEWEQKFRKYVGRYLPPEILPCLDEFVPKCSISMEPSKFSQLPDIHILADKENFHSEDVNMLLNKDFTLKDLEIYPLVSNNLYFDTMDMLNSNIMEPNSSENTSSLKARIFEQGEIISNQMDEIDKLRAQLSEKIKEADRAEKARQTHASNNESLRSRIHSIQEKLEQLARETPEFASKIGLLLEDI